MMERIYVAIIAGIVLSGYVCSKSTNQHPNLEKVIKHFASWKNFSNFLALVQKAFDADDEHFNRNLDRFLPDTRLIGPLSIPSLRSNLKRARKVYKKYLPELHLAQCMWKHVDTLEEIDFAGSLQDISHQHEAAATQQILVRSQEKMNQKESVVKPNVSLPPPKRIKEVVIETRKSNIPQATTRPTTTEETPKIKNTKKFDRDSFDSYWEALRESNKLNISKPTVDSVWKAVQNNLHPNVRKYIKHLDTRGIIEQIKKNNDIDPLWLGENKVNPVFNPEISRHQRQLNIDAHQPYLPQGVSWNDLTRLAQEVIETEAESTLFDGFQKVWKNDFFVCLKSYSTIKFWGWIDTA